LVCRLYSLFSKTLLSINDRDTTDGSSGKRKTALFHE
jgi:hypothetical protein